MTELPDDIAALELVLEVSILRDSFRDFARAAWPLVTGGELRTNYATDAIATVLQAVGDGQLRRVCIALAPGLGKSTWCSVLYPAWRWARDPRYRLITASHAHDIAVQMAMRSRRLIQHEWFRSRFGVQLAHDENQQARYATTQGGHRIAVGVQGAILGFRAHEAIADDPLDAYDARSRVQRDKTNQWFDESLSTRIDGEGALAVVQQRLDRDDVIGHLVARGGFELVSLPAEFDAARRCVVLNGAGAEIWRDPREAEGELLAPDTLSREKLDALKLQLGSAGYASQFQQSPADDTAALIKRAWWMFHRQPHTAADTRRPTGSNDSDAVATPEHFDRIVIACDLTFGSLTGDYAVIQAWGAKGGGRYLLEQWRKRAGFEESSDAIEQMAGKYPGAKILVEKAANGAAIIETLRKKLSTVVAVKPIGSKLQRLSAVSPHVEAGSCYLPLGAAWLDDFVEELAGATKHDDCQDVASYALHELAVRGKPVSASIGGSTFEVRGSMGGASFGGTDTRHTTLYSPPGISTKEES